MLYFNVTRYLYVHNNCVYYWLFKKHKPAARICLQSSKTDGENPLIVKDICEITHFMYEKFNSISVDLIIHENVGTLAADEENEWKGTVNMWIWLTDFPISSDLLIDWVLSITLVFQD